MIDPRLFSLLPPLRRARGDRLYGPDEKHWVDLWKQDGSWLLGRRPEGAAKEWKNQLDKGLSGWAPSHWPRRLESLIGRLIPSSVAVRIYRNADRAPEVPLWRPWEDFASGPGTDFERLRLVLPTGPGQAVALVYGPLWRGAIPDHEITSPAEASALVQAAGQVLRFTADPRAQKARAIIGETFDRTLGTTGVFVRHGLWFSVANEAWDYGSLFQVHFDAGFVLNPDPLAPGILSLDLSPGEWAKWLLVASEWKKGIS